MVMQRLCDVCDVPYEAKRPTSRFCSATCRKRASRGAVTAPEVEDLPKLVPEHVDGPVTESALAVLHDVERSGTPLGQAALALARRVDLNRDTGAGLAALVKQFEATLKAATADVKSAASPLDLMRDELAERRSRGA